MGSVVVPRHALLRDAMIFHGGLENHAVGELIDHAALYLLPRRLARRVFVGTLVLHRGAAFRELGGPPQHFGAPPFEGGSHAVAALSQSKPATPPRPPG